jgi:3-dehydroquinate synthase
MISRSRLSSLLPTNSTRIPVALGDRAYDVLIEDDLVDHVGEHLAPFALGPEAVVVTSPTIRRLYAARLLRGLKVTGFKASILTVPEGERVKSMRWLNAILDELLRRRCERKTWLVALGGGVIGDLTGFAASVYLRGIPFAQVPTSLVSQVDASIGGKTGVNHSLGKNLIGTFYQPKIVLVDPRLLTTLPVREYRAGLAEVIKYGVIKDADFFDVLERDMGRILALDTRSVYRIIHTSCRIKAAVVSEDEREGDRRRILNFGHTFGHALETVTGYRRYKHGETVAIGMVAAARLAGALGMADRSVSQKIENLARQAGLPCELPRYSAASWLRALRQDKKVLDRQIHFVLPRQIGQVAIVPVKDSVIQRFLGDATGRRGGSSPA